MAEAVGSAAASPAEDETEESSLTEDETEESSLAEDETDDSVTDLFAQLSRQASVLAFYETRLAASRRKEEIRRAAGHIAALLIVVVAFVTAFALANVAAFHGLSTVMSDWVAALVLAAAWAAVGAVLALILRARAKRVIGLTEKDAEEARAEAEQAVRDTLERLTPALSKEIALAALPAATGVASGVVDAGDEVIETVDEMVEELVVDLPGGGVVNQIWDVVLMPGRFGLRMATTVLKRGEPSS
jgi:hypothetical protein